MPIAELDATGRENDHRDAKFKVVAESVRHHVKEQENEMLPKVKGPKIDFEALGRQLMIRKEELREGGSPADAEHAIGRRAHSRADTPAVAARSKKSGAKEGAHASHIRGLRLMATKSSHSGSGRGPKGKRKIHKAMKEYKQGKLKSSSGKKVKSRKQAVAIALSEARRSGAKIPKKKS